MLVGPHDRSLPPRSFYRCARTPLRGGTCRNPARSQAHALDVVFLPALGGTRHQRNGQQYAITSLDEPRAYLAHPTLGSRLRECTAALQDLALAKADAAFGEIDAAKLRSSLTLFIQAGGDPMFEAALARCFRGQQDEKSLHLLGAGRA